MKQVIFNAQTGEITFKEVEEIIEIPPPQPQTPTVEERLQALEQLELERMFELWLTFLKFNTV